MWPQDNSQRYVSASHHEDEEQEDSAEATHKFILISDGQFPFPLRCIYTGNIIAPNISARIHTCTYV